MEGDGGEEINWGWINIWPEQQQDIVIWLWSNYNQRKHFVALSINARCATGQMKQFVNISTGTGSPGKFFILHETSHYVV